MKRNRLRKLLVDQRLLAVVIFWTSVETALGHMPAVVDNFARVDPETGGGSAGSLFAIIVFFIFAFAIYIIFHMARSKVGEIEEHFKQKGKSEEIDGYFHNQDIQLTYRNVPALRKRAAKFGDLQAIVALSVIFERMEREYKRTIKKLGPGSTADRREKAKPIDRKRIDEHSQLKIADQYSHWFNIANFLLHERQSLSGHQDVLDHYAAVAGQYYSRSGMSFKYPSSIHKFIVFQQMIKLQVIPLEDIDWNALPIDGIPEVDRSIYLGFRQEISKDFERQMNGYLIAVIDVFIIEDWNRQEVLKNLTAALRYAYARGRQRTWLARAILDVGREIGIRDQLDHAIRYSPM